MAIPRNEQETILNYDVERQKWHIYTDVPKHIRKWGHLVETPIQTEENGQIIAIDGYLSGSLSLRAPMSEENRKKARERMKGKRP